MRIARKLYVCDKCGRDLWSKWEKPGDLDATCIIVLPRAEGTDTFWCEDCYFNIQQTIRPRKDKMQDSQHTPESIAALPSFEEVEAGNEKVLQRLAERYQPIATEIIRLELERHILEIRLKALRTQLPPDFSKCLNYTKPGGHKFIAVHTSRDGQKTSTSIEQACPICGSRWRDYWEERLGITQARLAF